MKKISKYLSLWNKKRKKNFPAPFTSRKKYDQLKLRYDCLVNALMSFKNPLEKLATVVEVKPIVWSSSSGEFCLFVTHASKCSIKPHVVHHIQSFLRENFSVILIVNSDDINTPFDIPTDLVNSLSGLILRENLGFDFGAWSQIFGSIPEDIDIERMIITNDSIIGPLSEPLFKKMLEKIRMSRSDFVGLTKNVNPRPHLQSFFLVFQKRLVRDSGFRHFFSRLWSFPDKGMVVDIYETYLTRLLQSQGFTYEALFSLHLSDEGEENVYDAAQLEEFVGQGFPYVKTSIASKPDVQRILKHWLPSLY